MSSSRWWDNDGRAPYELEGTPNYHPQQLANQVRSDNSDIHDEPKTSDATHEAMIDCCLGAHPEVWYKFKRFECLSLLNLYYYQNELVCLDEKIFGTPDIPKDWTSLKEEEWLKLRGMIKEYQTAIQLFKQTSQMKRPTMKERKDTNHLLSEKFGNNQYYMAHDAMGMLDLSPEALNTTQDSLRAMLEKKTASRNPVSYPMNANFLSFGLQEPAKRPAHRLEEQLQFPDNRKMYNFRGRPLVALPVGRNVDRFIRFVVGSVAASALLVPLVVLSKIRNPDHTILATCLFVLLFASMVSMIGKKSTSEVMVAVATYTAVLVVFVGQTMSPRAAV